MITENPSPEIRKFEVCYAPGIASVEVEAADVEWGENLKFKRNGEVVAVFFSALWFKEIK